VPVSRTAFRASRPIALLALGAVELLEALGLAVLGVVFVVMGPGSQYPATAYGAGGTVLVLAALLLGVGIGTLRASPWTRSAGLVWHVVQVLVGLYTLTGAGPAVGVAIVVIVPAVVVIVLTFTRSVQEALARSTGAS
jgi:hypothetical protein